MRIRSFIIAYGLVLAILLFADRRPGSAQGDRYSHVIDLTGAASPDRTTDSPSSPTRIIAPGALIPGTWSAGQIPAERLLAPLVVMDLTTRPDQASQITLSDIADWESRHGVVAQGAVVDSATGFSALPETGSLVIVAPARNPANKTNASEAPVRILAMVR